MTRASDRCSFDIVDQGAPAQQVVAGFTSFGLAGLTAVDYIVQQLELEETGHITASGLPAIVPFDDGTPRHHTRLYSRPDLDLTVLVNELFAPPWATDPFAEAILDWTEANSIDEITVLSGTPLPHAPDDHRVFYVATEEYQDEQLEKTDVSGMNTGFLDGINASLVGCGMDSGLRVGVLSTPVHAQVPDVEAALRLIEITESLYDITVDTAELEEFGNEIAQYYKSLEEKLQHSEEQTDSTDIMYM